MTTGLLVLGMVKRRHHCHQRAQAAGGEEPKRVGGEQGWGGGLCIAGGTQWGLAMRRLHDKMQFVLLTEMTDHWEGVTGERVMRCGDADGLGMT
jgi:hypothetical protein